MLKWFTPLLLIAFVVDLHAQTISYSPYSAYGIGILKERTSAYNRTLAGTGIGIRDELNLNNANPAAYTSVKAITQLMEIGFFSESDKLKTSEVTEKSSAGNLTSINLWFRFSKKWATTIGLAPFSFINYDVYAIRNFGYDTDALIRYSGQGGLTQFYLGNAYQVTKNLSVGFNASYIFGNIEKEETILSGEAAGLSLENKTYVNRSSLDFGAQYTFFLPKKRSLTVGATYASKLRLNTSRTIQVYQVDGADSLYVEEKSINDFVLPSAIGTGISYQTPRHMVAMDLKFKNWSNATLDKGLRLQNTTRFSAAYEYRGNPNPTNYLHIITLRSGLYVQNNYFTVNSAPFNEYGFSVGAGFPLAGHKGSLNLSYHYNKSGTTENRLIQQQAQVLVLDIVFRDVWGFRRKQD